ncbi:MAG: glycine cleavage system protein GcvH [Prevotellaceae bacterium]|jgi:glycine cleavage system H protein|nr:glycine cleavage system protein GcvH [Prevotellaceae bacterium]
MNIPAQLYYTRDHEWIELKGNVATVGVTDYAQSQLGDVVFVDIQTDGEELEVGDVFGAIEAVKTVADALMPLSGTIVQVNPQLEGSPQLLNSDPYGEGWMIKIELNNPEEVSGLLSAQAYSEFI